MARVYGGFCGGNPSGKQTPSALGWVKIVNAGNARELRRSKESQRVDYG